MLNEIDVEGIIAFRRNQLTEDLVDFFVISVFDAPSRYLSG